MSGFDPGPGWREVTDSEYRHSLGQPRLLSTDGSQGQGTRYWVREAPVPPLPTAPYTVIRVTWKDTGDQERLVLSDSGTWWGPLMADGLRERITSFEVLSEPRAVTAKAVIDRVSEMWTGDERIWDVAREFGVES